MATAKTNSLIAAAVIAALLLGGGGVVAYKAVAAPRERSVQVAELPQANAATVSLVSTTDAAVAAPAGPTSLVFSDGSTMDLVGITDKGDPAKPWWSADGSLVAPIKTKQNMRTGFPSMPGMRTLQMIFTRSHTLKDDRVSVSVSAPVRFSGDGGDDKQQDCTFGVDSAVAKTNVIVRVASGPWATTERYAVKNGVVQPGVVEPATIPAATTPAATTKPSLQIQSLADRTVRSQKMAVLTVHRATRDTEQQQEIYLVTTTGEEIRSTGSTGRQGGISEYDFKVSSNDVAAVIARSRPYETRELRDVSLRPGAITNPATMPAK